MELVKTIKYYCMQHSVDVDFTKDIILFDDGTGRGQQIVQWNISDKLPQPSMEELEALEPEAMLYYARQNKTAELERKFNYMLENGHCTSSLGFEIDANSTSCRNVSGVLVVMGPDEVVQFCDYNNVFHTCTRSNLETIQLEIIEYGNKKYQEKWSLRAQILVATTAEEVEAITIDFGL